MLRVYFKKKQSSLHLHFIFNLTRNPSELSIFKTASSFAAPSRKCHVCFGSRQQCADDKISSLQVTCKRPDMSCAWSDTKLNNSYDYLAMSCLPKQDCGLQFRLNCDEALKEYKVECCDIFCCDSDFCNTQQHSGKSLKNKSSPLVGPLGLSSIYCNENSIYCLDNVEKMNLICIPFLSVSCRT